MFNRNKNDLRQRVSKLEGLVESLQFESDLRGLTDNKLTNAEKKASMNYIAEKYEWAELREIIEEDLVMFILVEPRSYGNYLHREPKQYYKLEIPTGKKKRR